MTHIERTKTISYRWRRNGGNEINPEHVSALEERADERIAEMMAQGYNSGELCEHIRTGETDPEDGVEYFGWWKVECQ